MADDTPPVPLAVVEFGANNTQARISTQEGHLIIDRPWDDDESQFAIPLGLVNETEVFRYLFILPSMDAFLHLDTNTAEFIFSYLNPENTDAAGYLDRKFKFHFDNVEYECSFAPPTDRLMQIARYFRRLPSPRGTLAAAQLFAFRDAQNPELPERARKYFEGKVPRSFFVKPSIPLKEVEWEAFSRHLNLLMSYYDRKSATIVYRAPKDAQGIESTEKLRFVEGAFPREMAIRPIDEILLRFIEVAKRSDPRASFVYCYQIFEYAGFYFIDAKTRQALMRILRSPTFISCAEDRLGDLLSVLTDNAQSDEVRIRKVIEDLCDPAVLWAELQKNMEFFSRDQEFVGGFSLPRLVSAETTLENWCAMWTPKLFDQVAKLRNCIVHAREKRESRVILPTASNDAKIQTYLTLVLRMAEQVAIHSGRG